MKDFATKHPKILAFSALVLACLFVFFVISTSPNSSQTPVTQSEIDGGPDGPSEYDPIPFTNTLYSITYNPQQFDNIPAKNNLAVQAYPGYFTAVLNRIHDFGYDTADYKITFSNYRNPFDAYK